jgi:hypothetical protein
MSLKRPTTRRLGRATQSWFGWRCSIHGVVFLLALLVATPGIAGHLRAGAAKVDVTHPDSETCNERLYVKALVLTDDETTAVVITVDAVAIGEIGPIKNDYLPKVRAQLEKELQIKPSNVLANASHCHGVVCADIEQKTVQAVKDAMQKLTPVKTGVGLGHEDRIMENRRLKLKNGREADVRHAYALPPDAEVVGVGPVDPQIGVLRLDTLDGRTVAVVYNFACHPIQGVPSGTNTADLVGFASRVIEDNLDEGATALFMQGCGGDVNPVFYKDVDHPRDAETLGNLLGLSTLKAVRKIECRETSDFKFLNVPLSLPRADLAESIAALQSEQIRLAQSLQGTSLNLKTFLPLIVKYNLSAEYPSYYSHRYLHDSAAGRVDLSKLDADNRRNIESYLKNIYTMEELTRVNTNLALLKKNQQKFIDAGRRTIDVELVGMRVGGFVLVTSPGELTVQIGLNIKQSSPHQPTFVAGYTNGYIYYAPTAEQLANRGGAQEDSDCILAPEWQKVFEDRVAEVLKKL